MPGFCATTGGGAAGTVPAVGFWFLLLRFCWLRIAFALAADRPKALPSALVWPDWVCAWGLLLLGLLPKLPKEEDELEEAELLLAVVLGLAVLLFDELLPNLPNDEDELEDDEPDE